MGEEASDRTSAWQLGTTNDYRKVRPIARHRIPGQNQTQLAKVQESTRCHGEVFISGK